MGFTLLESQACGTPALCTDAGSMSEFVEEGRTGFVVAQNSAEAIAAALRRITSCSQAEYAEFSRRSREWVAHLSWSEVVKQHLRLYSEPPVG
jgi:glycosyltransferase involved in cell wall biosynthesis